MWRKHQAKHLNAAGVLVTCAMSAQLAACFIAPATAGTGGADGATGDTTATPPGDTPAAGSGDQRQSEMKEPVETKAPPSEKTPPPAKAPPLNKPPQAIARPVESQVKESQPGRVHRVQMRLSGSSCLACLLELERKLKAMQGVAKVKIERPDETSMFYFGGPGASWSEATILYDPEVVPLQNMTSFMKTQGYHPWKVQDKIAR